MHTRFSTDSDADIRDMIESALKKGLRSICITDHIDKDYPLHEGASAESFLVGVAECKAVFPSGRIQLDSFPHCNQRLNISKNVSTPVKI